MKILHTSDWHLGVPLGKERVMDLQNEWMDQLLAIADNEGVEAVVLAGDVYDQKQPPIEAQQLFDRAMTALCLELSIPVLAIAGNHDSAARLTACSDLLETSGLYLCGRVTRPRAIVIGDVCFHLFPYFHTHEIRQLYPDAELTTDAEAFSQLAQDALAQHRKLAACHIAVAHAFVAGAEPSGSDRMAVLSVGGSQVMPAGIFDGFDYTALGHLHRFQHPSDRIWYSGTPAAQSFDESGQPKGVLIVDTDRLILQPPDQSPVRDAVRFIPIEPARRLFVWSGTLTDAVSGTDAEMPETAYLRISLTDEPTSPDCFNRLKHRYPNLVSLVSTWRPGGAYESDWDFGLQQLEQMTPLGILEQFYLEQTGTELPTDCRDWFLSAAEAVQSEPVETEAGA